MTYICTYGHTYEYTDKVIQGGAPLLKQTLVIITKFLGFSNFSEKIKVGIDMCMDYIFILPKHAVKNNCK